MRGEGSLVVDVGLLPLELQVRAEEHRGTGLIPIARKDDAGEWRVAYTDPERQTFPDERDVWVGWMRVVWPPPKRGLWK